MNSRNRTRHHKCSQRVFFKPFCKSETAEVDGSDEVSLDPVDPVGVVGLFDVADKDVR